MWSLLPTEVQLDPIPETDDEMPEDRERVRLAEGFLSDRQRCSGHRPVWRRRSPRLGRFEKASHHLLADCLANRQDHGAWWAFVQRHGAKLRCFLSYQLYRFEMTSGGFDLDDWEQEVYWRLLNFRRTTAFENERMVWRFLLEVVASVVVDGWRHRHRLKRTPFNAFDWRFVGSRPRRLQEPRKRRSYRHPPRSHRRKSR